MSLLQRCIHGRVRRKTQSFGNNRRRSLRSRCIERAGPTCWDGVGLGDGVSDWLAATQPSSCWTDRPNLAAAYSLANSGARRTRRRGRIDSTGQSRDQHDHESFFPGFLADQSSGGITVLGGIKFGRWLDPRSDARQRDFGDRSNGQLGNLTETRALNLGVPMSLSADLARHASAESAVYPGQNCALLFPQCFRGSQVCTAFLGPQRLLEACFHHARPHLGPGKELPAFERNFRQIFGSFHWDSATPH
jgi:hypothetical protein